MEKKIDVIFLDVKEIAEALGISTRTAYIYLEKGKIKGRKIGGKWKATKEAVESYINGE